MEQHDSLAYILKKKPTVERSEKPIQTKNLGVWGSIRAFLADLFGAASSRVARTPELFDGVPLPSHIFAQVLALRIKQSPHLLKVNTETKHNVHVDFWPYGEERRTTYEWEDNRIHVSVVHTFEKFSRHHRSNEDWGVVLRCPDEDVVLPWLTETEVSEIKEAVVWAKNHNQERAGIEQEARRQRVAADAIDYLVTGRGKNDENPGELGNTSATTGTKYLTYWGSSDDGWGLRWASRGLDDGHRDD